MSQRARAVAAIAVTTLVLAACGGDGETILTDPAEATSTVLAGEPFPAERCAANEAAGTIDYYTGFDYAAAASIIEVLVASDAGYYDDLCLDVNITPSFSTANYPLVAENDVQFSSSGSFAEMARFSAANEADLVTLSVDGHVSIDALMLKPDQVTNLADLAGATIGVKGALPPSVAAMLLGEGLVEGTDFDTVLLDGFDPVAHMAVDTIVGLPGWKSNEPGVLERAGVDFDLYDPAEFGIPGSFGIIYTNQAFLDQHPTAVEDFMRATMKGLNDAIADPAAAAAVAVALINGNGNPNFLSEEGETFRWKTDAGLIVSTTPDGMFPGTVAAAELAAEIAAYAAAGVYPNGTPSTDGRFADDLVANLYDADGTIIWPN